MKTNKVSPYEMAEIATKRLGKEIIPQKLYALIRKGKLDSSKNELGHHEVDVKVMNAWIRKQKKAA